MLPGFRFLFAAIVFSMSILIFGLGAAALLRAAHEEFANLPSRRSTPEPMFARRTDETPPTLALLRIDLPEAKPPETAPVPAPEAVADTPAQAQAPDAAATEPEKLVALKPAEAASGPAPVEAAKPDVATEAVAPATETSAGPEELKVAAITPTPEPAAAALPPAPASDISSFEDNPAVSRIATLGGPAVIVDEKAAAVASGVTIAVTPEAKADRSAIRKRAAERARERRQAAVRRARVAREATLAQQQLQANPFTQLPFPTNPTRQIQ